MPQFHPTYANTPELQLGPRLVTARSQQYDYADSVAPHSHVRAQLLYATEGLMRVSTAMGMWILPPRRALLIPPGVTHELTMQSKVSMRNVYIEPQAASQFGDRCRVIEVSALLRELIQALTLEPVDYPVPGRGQHLALLILSEIGAAATVPIAIPWPRDRRLLAVCNAIVAAPALRRSMDDWAGQAGASARTLIRLFPRETGLHYRQWLQQVHLADAFCRLARGDSVGDIARALGYASPSAFTAMFRRILGKTPQQYLADWNGQAR